MARKTKAQVAEEARLLKEKRRESQRCYRAKKKRERETKAAEGRAKALLPPAAPLAVQFKTGFVDVASKQIRGASIADALAKTGWDACGTMPKDAPRKEGMIYSAEELARAEFTKIVGQYPLSRIENDLKVIQMAIANNLPLTVTPAASAKKPTLWQRFWGL